MKTILRNILAKFNLRMVRENKFAKIIEDARYRSLCNILQKFGDIELLNIAENSRAERFQDVYVLGLMKKKINGYFVEFGAANGLFCSNTYLMEMKYNWNGILAEPARIWHDELERNRHVNVSKKCVFSETGKKVQFSEVSNPGLSTIYEYRNSDEHANDRSSSKKYWVETITLNDLLMEYKAPRYIDYISMDTEGSEFEILKDFAFENYDVGVFQIEHNKNITMRNAIKDLMIRNNYQLLEQDISEFDDFYIGKSLT